MRTIKIQVTADDIANGEPAECEQCPIALAARRAGLELPNVGDEEMIFEGGSCELPPEAADFIKAFDNDERVQPFEFELNIPAVLEG